MEFTSLEGMGFRCELMIINAHLGRLPRSTAWGHLSSINPMDWRIACSTGLFNTSTHQRDTREGMPAKYSNCVLIIHSTVYCRPRYFSADDVDDCHFFLLCTHTSG